MKKFWFLFVCLAFCCVFSTAKAQSVPTQNLIANGDFAKGFDSWLVTNNEIGRANVADVAVENGDPSKALRIEVKVAPDTKPWAATLHQKLDASFRAGDKVTFTGRARSPQGLMLYAYLEESKEPYGKQATIKTPLSPQWQNFETSGVLTRDFSTNDLTVGFQFAFGTGAIEIADLKLTRVGVDPSFVADPILAPNGDFSQPLGKSWNVSGQMPIQSKIVDVRASDYAMKAAGLEKVLQIEADSPTGIKLWDARVAAPPVGVPIRNSDMILVKFWGRSPQKNRVSPVFQQSKAPYNKSLIEIAYLQPDWKQFTYYTAVQNSFAAGESSFELQFGGLKGSIEVTGIHVENLGPLSEAETEAKYGRRTIDYYGSAKPDDSWKPAALARIEKYRKGDMEIRVVDASNLPVPNAKVEIIQTRQAFRFGTAVNRWLLSDEPDGEIYRAQVKRLFNTAVLENDMKWRLTDKNDEVTQRGVSSVKWLRDNGLEVRGHNMVWGSWRYSPPRIERLSPEEARLEIRKHIFEVGERYKGQVYVWDVVNEAVTNTDVFDRLGWDLFPQIYRWAREADKDAQLAYNDYDITNEAFDGGAHRIKVEARIKQLLDAKAPVDVLGDQAHMFTPLTPIPRLLEIWGDWDRKFGKPIEITEFDVGINDDAVQAKYISDYLIAAFSQPNVESFILWGFWEKAHWRASQGAALFRTDWTPRPSALAIEDLVLKQWRTNAVMATDTKGIAKTRGFLGDYEIRVSVNGKETTTRVQVTKKGMSKRVVVY